MASQQHTWTQQQEEFILDHVGKMTFVEIGRRLGGFTKNQVRGKYLRLMERAKRPREDVPGLSPESQHGTHIKTDQSKDSCEVVCLSPEIKTVEDALAKAEIDMDDWEVDRIVVNSWEVGSKVDGIGITKTPLWQVKVWLKRKKPEVIEVLLPLIIAEMDKHAPRYEQVEFPKLHAGSDRFAYEISVADLHAGKLAWAPETGEDYDTKIASKLFTDAVFNLVGRVSCMPVEEIWLPLGNDFFNTDNAANETTNGTPQDVDTRWPKSYMAMKMAVIDAIDALREIAPVKVVIVPGNHDRQKIFFFGDTLESWYGRCDNVQVDNAPSLRKRMVYGRSMIAFTHGDEEKVNSLPLLMANTWKEDWSKTDHHEWHLGHHHRSREEKFTAGDVVGGVVIRTLPSLSSADAWHCKKGYVHSPRAAEAYLWDYDAGYSGHYSYNYRECNN